LNYQTTAQNLRFAMGLLKGGVFVDLEAGDKTTGYRSARTGPRPRVIDGGSLAEELDAITDVVRE